MKENCEFICHKDEFITVIVGKSPEGVFKAYAVRCNDVFREELLASDSARSEVKALASLLAKSCEAVHQYHAANGFLSPSSARDGFDTDDEDEDDAASSVSGRTATTTAAFSDDNSSDDERPTPATSSRDEESYAAARASHRGDDSSRPVGPLASSSSNNNNHKNGTRKNRKLTATTAATAATAAGPLQIPSSTAARNLQGRYHRRDADDESEGEEGDRGKSSDAHYFHNQNPQHRIPMRIPQDGGWFTANAPVSSGARASLPSSRAPPPPPQGWASGPPPPPPMSSTRGGPMVPAGPPKPAAAVVAAASARKLMTMPSMPPIYHPQQPPAPQNLPVGQHQHQHHQRMPMPHPAHVHQNPNYTHGGGPALPPPLPPPTGMQQPALPANLTRVPSLSSPGGAHGGSANSNSNSNNNSGSSSSSSNGTGVSPTAALHDVLMTIRLPGRSEHRVLDRVRASVGALQEAALSYVRAHPVPFGGNTPMTATDQLQAAAAKPFTLHAVVHKALFGADAYDMTSYRSDDLSRLFAAMSASDANAIPSFDINVVEHHLRPGPGPVSAM